MLWWQRVKAKLRGVDDFYAELSIKTVPAYQRLFEQALRAIDVENQTAWSKSESYDKLRLEKDGEILDNLSEQALHQGLVPAFLMVMIHQYIFADPWQREWDRDHWAWRVMKRKEIDHFPSGWAVFNLLKNVT